MKPSIDKEAHLSQENLSVSSRPSLEQISREIDHLEFLERWKSSLLFSVKLLVVTAAVAVLVANYFFCLFKVQGNSMNPTYVQGDYLIAYKTHDIEKGDVIAFYYNNKILLKRVVAEPGDWVNIDNEGNVYVNDELLNETYLEEQNTDPGDITYPYQVPENQWFVLGDKRHASLDSRYELIGNVMDEQLLGKVLFKL
jgi:signal peptidase I